MEASRATSAEPRGGRSAARRTLGAWAAGLAVFAAFFAVYYLSGPARVAPSQGSRHFVYLAQALLQGHLELVSTLPSYHDMTYFGGKWYVAFPPLPAILLMPFVALQGLAVDERLISFAFGATNCALTWVMFGRLPERPTLLARLGLTVLFGLGTVHWYSALSGAVWYFAHVVSVTFVTLYVVEALGRNRPAVAAALLGLASLARTATLLGFPLFLAMAWKRGRREGWPRSRWVRQLGVFGAVLGVFVAAMAAYNYARFGSPADFGYLNMQIADTLAPRLRDYGQFSVHFLPENLYYFLVAPPLVVPGFRPPYLEPSNWGTGIVFVSPACLYALRGIRRSALGIGAALATILVALPNLLYYNTGWAQFGYRFTQDFLPFVVVLTALGMRGRLTRLGVALILVSVAASFWGARWFLRMPVFGAALWQQ